MNTATHELVLGTGLLLFTGIHGFLVYRKKHTLCLSDLCFWAMGLLVGAAPLLSYLLGNQNFLGDSKEVGFTYFAFITYGVGLIISKQFFKRTSIFSRRATANYTRSHLFYFIDHIREIPILIVLGSTGILIGIMIYNFSIGGGVSGLESLDVMVEKSYIVIVLSRLTEPFSYAISFYCFGILFLKDRKYYPVIIPILVFLAFSSFLSGRREMVFFLIIGLFAAFAINRKIKLQHMLFAGVGVYVVFAIVSPIFLSMRSAAQKAVSQSYERESTTQVLALALSEVQETEDEAMNEQMLQNLQGRFLNVRTVPYMIFQAQNHRPPMMGLAFLQAQLSVIPRFFRPQVAWINPELFVQLYYGLSQRDISNSVVGLFVADFSIFGGIIGGIVMGIYLNGLSLFAFKLFNRYPIVGLAIFGTGFVLALNAEINPSFFLTEPRNLMILIVFFEVLRSFNIKLSDWDRYLPNQPLGGGQPYSPHRYRIQ